MSAPQGHPDTISLCSQPPSCKSGDATGQAKLELGLHPHLSDKRNWLRTLLLQTACFFWLAPIAALLALNFKKHVLGATAWCPHGNCYVDWNNPVRSIPLANLHEFDKHDHDLLGWLQLVAKALEIWFELVALALVYLITFFIAGKVDGLPIGYLMRPSEFSNVPGLFDPLLWTPVSPVSKARDLAASKIYRLKIALYIAFTVMLCILCNLMGPATAVLAIPSLQWIDTPLVGNRTFGTLNSGTAPSFNSGGPFNKTTCSEEDFMNLSFSCAANRFAPQLDSWIESYIGTGEYMNGDAQEEGLKFDLNMTFRTSQLDVLDYDFSDFTWWAPSRQVLSSLNADWLITTALSIGADSESIRNKLQDELPDTLDTHTYDEYNRSIEMFIQRNGPIVGAIVQRHEDFNATQTWSSIIDDSHQIRCYRNYSIDSSPLNTNSSTGNYTKCLRVGDGWSPDNKQVSFALRGSNDSTNLDISADVVVNVTTSDKAQLFVDGVLPAWLPPECLSPGLVPSSVTCDWDRLFHIDADDKLFNRTQNVVTIEMSTHMQRDDLDFTWKIAFDFVAFLGFTTYQFDPSPLTNPMSFVQAHDTPTSGEVIKVDPAWVLAAWSVDNGGVLHADRTATVEMLRVMNSMGKESPASLIYMSILPIVQALSLIDFTNEESVSSGHSSKDAARHPLLTRNARIYVWAYGFTTRTSKLGLIVVMAGVVVVMVQCVLGFIDRRKYRSPTQLLVAALEHAPSSEFKEMEHDDARVASTRFHVQATMTNAGKYSFKKMEADK